MTDLSGTTFCITGANTGIGRDTALALARRGGRVIIASRSRERTQPVLDEISAAGGDVAFVACDLAERAGAHFVKTSTGFSSGGATYADVALLHRIVGGRMGVKASGGIRDAATARRMIAAGATRLGTSASVQLVLEDPAARG